MSPSAEKLEDIKTWRRMQRMLPPVVRMERGGFPHHRRVPLSTLSPRSYQREQWLALQTYVDWFYDNWNTGLGMTLLGPPGKGKTTMACGVACELMTRHKYVCAYTTLDRYIRDQQRLMTVGKMSSGGDMLANEARVEMGDILHSDWIYRHGAYLLVLDDVGREYRSASGWAAQEFDSLLRSRYDAGLPTIITTNIEMNKWSEEYSESMRSFVREACPVVEFA